MQHHSSFHKSYPAPCQPHPHHPWFLGHRAEYPFLGTGDSSSERQTGSGSPKDIAEVKNAYEIYEWLEELNPYSVDDLLTAHGIMTRGLMEESGVFRTRPVGVVDSEGHVLHFGTLPQYVPDLVMELLDWVKNQRGTHAHPQLRVPLRV